MHQFFYKHKVETGKNTEGQSIFQEIELSFALDKVLYTTLRGDGSLAVHLDDWHEEANEVEVEARAGKKEKRVIKRQSSSYFLLNPEQAKQYKELTNAADWSENRPAEKYTIEEEFPIVRT